MRIQIGMALALGFLIGSGALSAPEPKGSKFPLRPAEFTTSYRTFDGELAEVQYQEVRTLKYKDRLVLYRKMVIHVKMNSILPWKKEVKLTGWMVAGYLEAIEGDGNDRALSVIATFAPIAPADMKRVGELIPRESVAEEDMPVWFWAPSSESDVSFPW